MSQDLPARCDAQAEAAVLGRLFLQPELLATAVAALGEDAFAVASHRLVWAAMSALDARGEGIDLVTVASELRRAERLNAVGGPSFLSGLWDVAANAAYFEDHLVELRTLASVRAVGKRLQTALQKAKDPRVPLDEVVAAAAAAAEGSASSTPQPVPLGESINRVFHAMEHPEAAVPPLSTGLRDLDAITNGGFRPGQLLVLAARPAQGKSSLAAQIGLHIARTTRRTALMFSLEMERDDFTKRLLAAEAGVPLERVLGTLGGDDMADLAEASQRLYDAPLLIDDRGEIRLHELRAVSRSTAQRCDLGIIIIDYMQLMTASRDRDNREREVAEMSRGLKSLAKSLGVPVLALSQLNRGPEQRPDKRPMLSDLRESGAIEQDADVVMFTYREHTYDKNADPEAAELLIAKQRQGRTGTVHLRFLGSQTRFIDATPEQVAAAEQRQQGRPKRGRRKRDEGPQPPRATTHQDSGEWPAAEAVGDDY